MGSSTSTPHCYNDTKFVAKWKATDLPMAQWEYVRPDGGHGDPHHYRVDLGLIRVRCVDDHPSYARIYHHVRGRSEERRLENGSKEKLSVLFADKIEEWARLDREHHHVEDARRRARTAAEGAGQARVHANTARRAEARAAREAAQAAADVAAATNTAMASALATAQAVQQHATAAAAAATLACAAANAAEAASHEANAAWQSAHDEAPATSHATCSSTRMTRLLDDARIARDTALAHRDTALARSQQAAAHADHAAAARH